MKWSYRDLAEAPAHWPPRIWELMLEEIEEREGGPVIPEE